MGWVMFAFGLASLAGPIGCFGVLATVLVLVARADVPFCNLRYELRTLSECRYRIWVVGKLI